MSAPRVPEGHERGTNRFESEKMAHIGVDKVVLLHMVIILSTPDFWS